MTAEEIREALEAREGYYAKQSHPAEPAWSRRAPGTEAAWAMLLILEEIRAFREELLERIP